MKFNFWRLFTSHADSTIYIQKFSGWSYVWRRQWKWRKRSSVSADDRRHRRRTKSCPTILYDGFKLAKTHRYLEYSAVTIQYSGGAIAQWIRLRLPSCCSGFNTIYTFLSIYIDLRHVEKTKINKKRPWLAHLKKPIQYFLNGPSQPLFRLFSSKEANLTIFVNKFMWKLSIQYMVLGFAPTTFKRWVYSHKQNTRATAQFKILITYILFHKMSSCNIESMHTLWVRIPATGTSFAQIFILFCCKIVMMFEKTETRWIRIAQ